MSTERKSFIIYTEWYDSIQELTLEQRGELFTNMFFFHTNNKTKINLENLLVKLVFKLIEPHFERNIIAYDKRRETSKQNGLKGGRPRKYVETKEPIKNLIKPKKPLDVNENINVNDNLYVNDKENVKGKFLPPSIIEIEEYFLKKLDIENKEKSSAQKEKIATKEAEKFHNYYEGIGWVVKGTPIAKWKNVATGWFSKIDQFKKRPKPVQNEKLTGAQDFSDFIQNSISHE